MKRLALLVAIVAAVLSVWSAPASASYFKRCGSQNHSGAGWYDVKAHGIGCEAARQIARDLAHHFDPPIEGFACQTTQAGYELTRVSCRRDLRHRAQKIRFYFGA